MPSFEFDPFVFISYKSKVSFLKLRFVVYHSNLSWWFSNWLNGSPRHSTQVTVCCR